MAKKEKKKEEPKSQVDMYRPLAYSMFGIPQYQFDVIMESAGVSGSDLLSQNEIEKHIKNFNERPIDRRA